LVIVPTIASAIRYILTPSIDLLVFAA